MTRGRSGRLCQRWSPDAVEQRFHRRARRARRAGQGGPLDPRGDPLRQPVARHGLGEVRHRPGARDDRRPEGAGRRHGALRRRRQRPRDPAAARGVPQDGRGRGPQLVHALVPRQGPPALHARSDDRRSLRRAAGDRRARHRSCSCSARRRTRCRRSTRRTSGCVTRGDLDYTALWILYAATPLARVEVIGRRLLADREVIPQALDAEPGVLQDHLHATC